MSHNPYFNRWFSAIKKYDIIDAQSYCHNPYFNRWFSAIDVNKFATSLIKDVTILILIDGFLQWGKIDCTIIFKYRSQSLF